ncbi:MULTISPECIES: Ldh family oxidoreductase [unclassified Rathayibacter]|uniref:Ldh family oxidoreductase n=1 Tax=unclassified Rathayibacter TaxID=2609250 RepID=UPI000F4D050A|nr:MULTISPECIES: Ldh family oxidoreductase [unclassified Rathayibacter]ROP49127.1 LDH2 family malate/lactate/ureidoglycolate dehydrogenase [Rathayibacter sp. PhB186]ROS50756.1 LDH2 family malate/lactate/ureidoglycolate dehydrogenase [Rathayibacter sp. PhB185]
MAETTTERDRIAPAPLRDFGREVLEYSGVPTDDAALVSDSLVQADLWGHQSHGLLRLPWYIDRLRTGAMKAVTEPTTLIDTGSLLLLDGHDGIGQVLTDRARSEAVRRARLHGIGAVGVRNSNHFGTAMYFTRRAAAEGCAAILTTNASPAMAPWGGREKGVGTNPWSIAAPYGEKVVALDIANTAVARGKIYLARQEGVPIPSTWALTPDGHETTDAEQAVHGVILPMAGHKGYAISFMMDVLSGALTGSQVGRGVHGPYEADKPSGAGHLFIAIDVAAMGDPEDFAGRVHQMVDEVKQTPLAPGYDEIFYPGELEDRAEIANRASGILLPENTWLDLQKLATETGLDLPRDR